MSFLDNLENNLKAMESRTERDPEALAGEAAVREAARFGGARNRSSRRSLRNGPFKDAPLTACRDIGHCKRALLLAPAVLR
jgi:hypothetical protein